MNVMEADIPCEPLEDFRQLEIRAAFKRDAHRMPRSVPRPIHVLKLMLDIEQPQPETSGNRNDRKLNQKVCPQTNCPARHSDNEQQCEVRAKDAPALPFPGPFGGKPVKE